MSAEKEDPRFRTGSIHMGIFPPDELVQLEEGHFPCESCGSPIDEKGAHCAACEDADEHDRWLHEVSHGPVLRLV